MNGIDILGNLSNTVDPGSLINYQPKLTVTKTTASPLSFTNNILTIDLSNYSTTILNNTLYQKNTASSPLSLNTTTNILSIDLSNYSTTAASYLRYQKLTKKKKKKIYVINYGID